MTVPPLGSDGFFHPRDEGEIKELIALGVRQGKTVRARGAAHSVHAAIFTDAYRNPHPDRAGINILLDGLRRVEIDAANQLVTVQAGCNLGRDPMDPSRTSTEKNYHGSGGGGGPDCALQARRRMTREGARLNQRYWPLR